MKPASGRMTVGRRGFATITAITLIGLMGFALVCLTRSFAFDSRRTMDEAVDSQVRLLVEAGKEMATQPGRDSGGMERELPLPAELAAVGAKVALHVDQSAPGRVEIVASEGHHHRQQAVYDGAKPGQK